MKKLDILDKRAEMIHLFRKNGVSLAFLFGSTLESDTSRDVDIALLFKKYDFNKYLETYEELHRIYKPNNIDVVVLNRSNAPIKLEALLKGIPLFVENEEDLSDFVTQILFEYEDYRYFKKEYSVSFEKRILEGLSMAERKLNKERIEAYLSKLDEAVGELAKLRNRFKSFDDFNGNIENRELCVHYLRIALESVLDVCRHFLAVKGISLAEIDTTNFIELSGEKGLIPYDFAKKIRGMAGMRNAIVHVYWKLDYEAIYRVITQELTDFDQFVRYVREFIKKQKA